MRSRKNPPDTTPPANFNYEAWTGPAPLRPYNELVHPRSWRAFMELDQYSTDESDNKDRAMELHVASAIRGHMRDFLAAIDTRSKPVADIEQGHISSAACFMANAAMKLGRAFHFDPETHTIFDDPDATAMLKRPYRKPYVHPSEA